MFHAISVKPGENHVTSLRMVWRVTSVALDHSATLSASEADSKNATAVCFHKDGVAHTLCTLRPRVCEQQLLDLTIAPEQPIEFSVRGMHPVHLSGALSFDDESLSDAEDSDDFAGASEDSSDAMEGMEFEGEEDDSEDEDEDDSEDDQVLVNVDESYGTLALAALVQGQEFEESEDSEDDEWGDDDNIDDEEEEGDSEEDSDEGDSEDDEPRIQELTEEEMQAFLKSQQQSERLKREKKPLSQTNKSPAKSVSKAEKSPAKALKSPATKAANYDENGEPMAKRKPVVESPKPAAAAAAEEAKHEAKKQQQTQKLAGGLTAKTIKQGTGKGVKPGQRVFVRYRGRLAHNNKEFDSNMTGKPFAFRLGKGEVIKGWDQGVKGMKSGEVRELKIPPALGYGGRGSPPTIPGNSTLLFTVELLRFK